MPPPPYSPPRTKNEYIQKYLDKSLFRHYERRWPELYVHAISLAEKEVKIAGINALGPIHQCFNSLKKKRYLTIEVQLLNPDSPSFKEREIDDCSINSKRLRYEWVAAVSRLTELKEHKCNINAWKVDNLPGSIVIIDEWLAQIQAYQIDKEGAQFEKDVLIVLNIKDGKDQFKKINDLFQKGIDKNKTIPLDSAKLPTIYKSVLNIPDKND